MTRRTRFANTGCFAWLIQMLRGEQVERNTPEVRPRASVLRGAGLETPDGATPMGRISEALGPFLTMLLAFTRRPPPKHHDSRQAWRSDVRGHAALYRLVLVEDAKACRRYRVVSSN